MSFMFGTYTQTGSRLSNRSAGDARFMYATRSDLWPSMLTDEITIERAPSDTNDRGFQSWQWIDAQWNTLWFDTGGGVDCAASVTAGFYQTGASLATALQNAMNATSCGSDFTVVYQEWDGRFTFGRSGLGALDIHWGNGGANNIAEALGGRGYDDYHSDTPNQLLLREGSGSSGWITFEFTEDVDGSPVTFYQARAGRLWNGETLRVQEDGTICAIDFGDASTRTNPPSFTVQQVRTGCGSDLTGQSAVFEYAGGQFTGNSQICYGFQAKVGVVPCDLAASQIDTIGPHIDLELPFDADGTPQNYTELMDGSWAVDTYPLDTQGGAKADGFTPIRNSLLDLKVEFQKLWDTGPLPTDPGYNPAWDSVTPPGQKAIKNHVNPKEKTIVLLITDGDDTCGADRISSGGGADNNARLAAYAAEDLYRRLDINEPTSSVETFVIGFAGGTPNRLNWIAWGGSGLTRGSETGWTSASSTALADARDLCTTCQDALIAPDAATLERQIQAIIDQGATIGTFSASRQSITDSVYEYVYLANDATNTFSPTDPDSRYQALAPTRFVSNFELPGFRGELTAWQDRNANGILEDPTDVAWRAGEKLLARVRSAFIGCAAGDDLCTFSEINGRIDRKIYTTEGNGVFYDSSNPVSLAGFGAGTTPQAARESLWPLADPMAEPFTGFDAAAGIPTDLTTLQSVFGACVREASAVLPTGCISNPLQEATREARQIILAYMAGADRVIAGTLGEPMRDATGNILYRPRAWMLAETTQATAAVLGPPLSSEPEVFSAEFRIFRDGRNSAGDPLSSGMVDRGCGLRDPADDNAIQPVMTQVFLPANDMLHAFRAGPCDGSCSSDTGGEELWGFVPYDLLPSLRDRFIEQPQGRENHVYMLARGIRYADVFFPVDTTDSAWCGSGDGTTINGIWRRVLFLPRGAGGKYMTALDVTSPGDLTTPSAYARGPVPLWSRGNPDQVEATQERAGSTDNHDRGDTADYAHMGETWSLPVVALVDSTNSYYNRSPRDNQRAVTHALFMGSGYGDTSGCPSDPCEGQTFYTLDALTGDIIATADVGERAELVPTGPDDELRWENALVANAAGFNPRAYSLLETVHPSASKVTRVYIADLHGRLWKFLTAEPDVAIQMADLSTIVNPGDPAGPAAQPVATAAGLIGLPPYQGDVNLVEPHVFVTSGYDRRATEGPFKIFGFRDTGGPTDTQLGTARDNPDQNDPNAAGYCPAPCNVRTYDGNAGSELLFARPFDEGVAVGGCTNPIPGNVFRGTVQPATSFEPCDPTSPTCTLAVGRVFFGGTRLNLPATEFAPPTPLACSTGDYPCRSSFDSILYALGAATGMAAYDINLDPTADDAYRIYRDQRITAVTMAADPAQSGGARVLIDEGQVGGATPIAPPPAGVPPSVTTAGTGIVVMSRDANFPPAAVRVGSSVCQ
ncbi:MAG: hypothetical protein LJF30_15640 [Acidobacteria bacterium]|nr:hypothetical protein [Acidobacteriota bacterium]